MSATALATGGIGSSPLAGAVDWEVPTATLTFPTAADVTTPTVTATWTYVDTGPLAQLSYRVLLSYTSSGNPLYDTGHVTGTDLTFDIPTLLTQGSNYTVSVWVKNTQGNESQVSSQAFGVDLTDVTDYPIVETVGTVYQVAINGVGYMLADNPDKDQAGHLRQSVSLDPPRLATTATPFSEAIDRYAFDTVSDVSHGAGQHWGNRNGSDVQKFHKSQGVDPFTVPGHITLLKATEEEIDDTYADLDLVVVGETLYAQTAASELTYVTTPGGSETPISITDGVGAVTITSLCTDGQYWYASAGADGIMRGTTTNPAAVWSDPLAWPTTTFASVGDIDYAGGRICVAAAASGASSHNVFHTLAADGDPERVLGHITFDDGVEVRIGGSTGGFIFFSAGQGNNGSIWAWPMGLTESGAQLYPFEVWTLPEGMYPEKVSVGGGYVWVRAVRPQGSGADAYIYQCVVSDTGALVPRKVVNVGQNDATIDHTVGDFAVCDDQVLFSWKKLNDGTVSGVGAVDLKTGGYATWFQTGSAALDVKAIDVWQGRCVFALQGDGVYVVDPDVYQASGWLQASETDGASALVKSWDDLDLVFEPLEANVSVTAEYSLDSGNSWTTAGVSDTSGMVQGHHEITKTSRAAVVRTTIATSDGVSTPTLSIVGLRFHALGLSDSVTQILIDCRDEIALLNGRPMPGNGPGAGSTRARTLEGLNQQRVLFQDIDWHITGDTIVSELETAETQTVLLYDTHTSTQRIGHLVAVTLRHTND